MNIRNTRITAKVHAVAAFVFAVAFFEAIPARAAGLFLTEMGTPDLGTAAAGRAAAADNAATAFGNPAGMTRLDSSQLLVGLQPGYGSVNSTRETTPPLPAATAATRRASFPGGFLLCPQRHPGLQARPLDGLQLRPQRRDKGLVRALLRHQIGTGDLGRLAGRGVPGDRLALRRRRRADRLWLAQQQDRGPQRLRRVRRTDPDEG